MTHLHITTPYIESRARSIHAGRSVWLKMEALQPLGSFKIRGIGLKGQVAASNGAHRFISSSGGNAGIAVAYAGGNCPLR
ncbi:MAG: pyridoxal-phosphate dependent enzyme [Comamonadaceae bacterium]